MQSNQNLDIKTIKSNKLNEEYFEIKHKSGLKLMLFPMKGYSTAHVLFATKYGSCDSSFKTSDMDNYITVPDGIAHFLEHKMFEDEDGDAFERFSDTGANANAFTTFDKTAYLFSCADSGTGNFYKSLEILLDFVQKPYFTEDSVKKEQGIIGQEIKMYDDDPNWMAFFNLLRSLYINNPIKTDVVGTTETISKITPKLLYDCYYTFYNLNNMVLSIAGDFDIDKVLSICDKLLKKSPEKFVESEIVNEPLEVREKIHNFSLPVSMPLFTIGIKLPSPQKKSYIKDYVLASFATECVMGESTDAFKKLYDKNLISQNFDSDVLFGRDYLSIIFEGESKESQKVFDEILNEYKTIQKTGLNNEVFETIKKSFYGKNIKSFSNVQNIANAMVGAAFYDYSLFEMIDVIANMTITEVNEYIKSIINVDNSALSIINPQ